jgi:hypothetical protein
MHVVMFSALIVVVLVATTLLFAFWVLVMLFRGVSRLFLGPGLRQQARTVSTRPVPVAPNTKRCGVESCRSVNPTEAKFCRRCGHSLETAHAASQPAPARRVAML